MSRNKKFRHEYTIIIEGITTNDFASESFGSIIESLRRSWNSQHEKTKVTYIRKDIK